MNLTFKHRDTEKDLSAWLTHDKANAKIVTKVDKAILNELDAFKKLHVRIVAADAGTGSYSPCGCFDKRVLLELSVTVPCDTNFSLVLDSPVYGPSPYFPNGLNWTALITYPTYSISSTKCVPSGNPTTYSYADSTSPTSKVSWIGHDAASGKIKAAPQRADFKLHSQTIFKVRMTATDKST